jgi:hypothetical protein
MAREVHSKTVQHDESAAKSHGRSKPAHERSEMAQGESQSQK